MFLIDKYKTNKILPSYNIISNLLFSLNMHNQIFNNIDSVVKLNYNEFKDIIYNMEHDKWKYANLPHLILYGPEGCGKEFLVNIILETIFTKKSVQVEEVEYIINSYSNTKTKINIKQSKHHIVIEPNNNGFDKYLIQEIIDEYANSEILNVFKYNNLYKIVIINLIDNLSYYAQASLRRTMEKCANKCKFIFICNQLSKIQEPLKSRCLMVRIPMPNKIQLTNMILQIAELENIKLTGNDIIEIINNSNNNINKVFWLLEIKLYKIDNYNFWQNNIYKIINIIFDINNYNSKNMNEIITQIRELLYQLFITNIDFHIIIKELMICLKNKINNNIIKKEIINYTSIFENRICSGTRHIVHIEAYILKIIQLLYNNNLI